MQAKRPRIARTGKRLPKSPVRRRSKKPPTRRAAPVAAPQAAPGRPSNCGRKFPPEILTPDEVRALIKRCSSRAPTGIRNRALIAVLWRAQLRVSEALALFAKDVDLDAGTVTVLHGKGDKSRTVGIDQGAAALVARWLDRRRALGLNGHSPVFCTLAGGPISAAYVRALLPRLARRVGIEKRVHAHALRHTGAAELAREGKSLNLIQQQLGHSSLATTDRYLRHIAPTELVKAMHDRAWDL
jgi:site-specific recombinase XerD